MRILAVDDDPVFLELLGKVLETGGYQGLVSCKSAEEALEVLSQAEFHFDCFLLDISMPGKDGIYLCKEIRSVQGYQETPILMITASCDLDHVDKAFSAGATDYVSKPIRGLELGSRIRVANIVQEQARRLSRTANEHGPETGKFGHGLSERFEDEFSIRGIAGSLDFQTLEIDLLRMPIGLYNLGIFALKIEGSERYFLEHGSRGFHDFITRVANFISKELSMAGARFAYAGKGIFGCAVFGRERLPSELGLNESFNREFQNYRSLEAGLGINLKLLLAAPRPQSVWTGRTAAEALRKAVEKAERRAADILVQRNLDAERLKDTVRPRPHRIGLLR